MSEDCAKPSSGEAAIAMEQFIPDHVFLYATQGSVNCYDGNKRYTFDTGDYCIARKNRLARYESVKGSAPFEKIVFCFEESFLRAFQEKYKPVVTKFSTADTFITVSATGMIADFIQSLKAYSDGAGRIEAVFEDLKYEELLILLIKNQPELAGLFFDYAAPEKLNLEEFMNRNYKFNVRIERFAYLTGRSLSAFKRDFFNIFNQTPNRWLVQKRLQEAHYLIAEKGKKASDIYVELGFEDLSHFSFAFKKLFGLRPTELAAQIKSAANGMTQ